MIFTSPPGDEHAEDVGVSGLGMDEETLSHIFEPFFTTKDTGKGTGLGLSIAREIIERHQGRITAANREDGTGAVFTLWMPVMGAGASSD